MLDLSAVGPGFKSQPRRCRATVLGKLFTPTVPLFHQAAKLVAALLRVVRVTAGLAKSNGSLPPGLWLTSDGLELTPGFYLGMDPTSSADCLGVYLRRTCSRVTSASSALGVLNDYALDTNPRTQSHSRHLQAETAKNRDQLRNPTLGNRVRAAFYVTLGSAESSDVVGCGRAKLSASRAGVWVPGRFTDGHADWVRRSNPRSRVRVTFVATIELAELLRLNSSALRHTRQISLAVITTHRPIHIERNDFTESMVTIRSPFCGYNTT